MGNGKGFDVLTLGEEECGENRVVHVFLHTDPRRTLVKVATSQRKQLHGCRISRRLKIPGRNRYRWGSELGRSHGLRPASSTANPGTMRTGRTTAAPGHLHIHVWGGGTGRLQVSPAAGVKDVTSLMTSILINCYWKAAVVRHYRYGKRSILTLRRCQGTKIKTAMQKTQENRILKIRKNRCFRFKKYI